MVFEQVSLRAFWLQLGLFHVFLQSFATYYNVF